MHELLNLTVQSCWYRARCVSARTLHSISMLGASPGRETLPLGRGFCLPHLIAQGAISDIGHSSPFVVIALS
jgi:hypothetical protein